MLPPLPFGDVHEQSAKDQARSRSGRCFLHPRGGFDAQVNDWRFCWPSSLGHWLTKLGCERDHFDRSRSTSLFCLRRFACADLGLLVRTFGGHNGSARRRSVLPMLLSPRENITRKIFGYFSCHHGRGRQNGGYHRCIHTLSHCHSCSRMQQAPSRAGFSAYKSGSGSSAYR